MLQSQNMRKRVIKGTVRNKETTKLKLLQGVGKILRRDGFKKLGPTNIAKEVGVDKKLIYDYFGNSENLVNEYLKSRDYWNNMKDKGDFDISDGGKRVSIEAVLGQYKAMENKELQKIILWELSEKHKILRKIADEREAEGEVLFNHISDPYFGEMAKSYRATIALLISGIYYLSVHTEVNGSTFCGLNLKNKEDKGHIEEAIKLIIELMYGLKEAR